MEELIKKLQDAHSLLLEIDAYDSTIQSNLDTAQELIEEVINKLTGEII